MEFADSISFLLLSCIVGLTWALYNWWAINNVRQWLNRYLRIERTQFTNETSQTSMAATETENPDSHRTEVQTQAPKPPNLDLLVQIGQRIHDGANAFLYEEYKYCCALVLTFSIPLIFIVSWQCSLAFVIGAATSLICGYIGMYVATCSNYRTAYMAINNLAAAFQVAYRAGCVMGFCLVSLGLLVFTILLSIYVDAWSGNQVYEDLAGFGLGGSTVALFARVGGGIYTKAADVGADLVGKVEEDFAEDSPKNPATIADNVGDNVGDIAGMGSDLFGSFAEATCAALVVSAGSLTHHNSAGDLISDKSVLMYPLLQSGAGILVCVVTSFIGIYITKVYRPSQIERTLKLQLFISTIILTPVLFAVSSWVLPITYYYDLEQKAPWHAAVCSIMGLWGGLIIGFYTEYMTSGSYSPVKEVVFACQTGAATNIIYGLALGYLSTTIPIFTIAVTAYTAQRLLSFYGVALAALGMLSNLCIGLAIDGYGPISDNAGGIAEMAELGAEVRERTDALDAAGNTTAAVGKGFAIGSAALVALSLYGGFVHRATTTTKHIKLTSADIMDPIVFGGLLIGAMLPQVFSALTIKSVGRAASEMVVEIRRQLSENPGIRTGEVDPDFQACIHVSTKASLREMILPGVLVIGTPIVFGVLWGPQGISGLLPGALIGGVQMAISSANTGGAWDNAKKYIESGGLIDEEGRVRGKGSDEHKAAVIGDTVGDPLKDTSGPALNILIKLMAILSLVLADFFCSTGYLARIWN